MREEYSDRKLFLGMALSPQNSASPSSATSAMMWLLRSIAHSLSASEARSAWADGTMREPGSLAACASASLSSRTRSGTNRNSPLLLERPADLVDRIVALAQATRPGRREQPKKSRAHDQIVAILCGFEDADVRADCELFY